MASPGVSSIVSMETIDLSSSMMSPNTSGVGADDDTIGSATKDFSEKFTPMTWSKTLNTPTPNQVHTINTNMSSVTYMKPVSFNNENETPMCVNQTPMRDLNPEYQDAPEFNCPLSINSQVSNSSLESPPVVKVLSPASQFRLKRAVFESRAQAVKSPNRKQRAQNVTALENSPSVLPFYSENGVVSPCCAIESELGDEPDEMAVATAHALPVSMQIMATAPAEEEEDDEYIQEKGQKCMELQYEAPQQVQKQIVEEVTTQLVQNEPQHEQENTPTTTQVEEIALVESFSVEPNNTQGAFPMKSLVFLILALLFSVAYFTHASFSSGSAPLQAAAPSVVGPLVQEMTAMEAVSLDSGVPVFDENSGLDDASAADYGVLDPSELSLSVTYKTSLWRDARELTTALYVRLHDHAVTKYAQVHGTIAAYDAQHGRRLESAYHAGCIHFETGVLQLRAAGTQVQNKLRELGVIDEWNKVRQQVTSRLAGIDTSGLKNAFEMIQTEWAVHGPVVKEKVEVQLQRAQQATTRNLLQWHRFIKENELLADEFY